LLLSVIADTRLTMEGRMLTWSVWVVTYRDGFTSQHVVTCQ